MISDLTDPLLGNARAGFMANARGVAPAIWIGGVICLVGVLATGVALLRFRAYRSTAPRGRRRAPAPVRFDARHRAAAGWRWSLRRADPTPTSRHPPPDGRPLSASVDGLAAGGWRRSTQSRLSTT